MKKIIKGNDQNLVKEVNVTQTEVVLNSLDSNTAYDVSVESVNRYTRSLKKSIKKFTSKLFNLVRKLLKS